MLWSIVMNATNNKPLQSHKKSTNDKTSREILPILIPCEKGEPPDGVANFQLIEEGGGVYKSGGNVRLLRNRDILEGALRKTLNPEDYDLLTGILDLKEARETATLDLKKARIKIDSLLLARAYQKLAKHLGWTDIIRKYPLPSAAWANVHVPRLATESMAAARLVLWYSKRLGRFIPAIHCPNLRTAIFARAFLTLQTCPKCGEVFLPDKKNRIYCRPAHGQAHRVARMRAKQGRKYGKS